MLVISRKEGERIHLGNDVVVVVNKIQGNRVSIAIEAPKETHILRGELKDKEDADNHKQNG